MQEKRRHGRWAVAVAVVATTVASGVSPAGAAGRFSDDDGSVHEGYIEAVAEAGIAQGCAETRYCPNDPVRRDQMATFLARALELPAASRDHFPDDDGNTHEDNINRIAEAGITTGDASGRYDPSGTVNRAQMATFLVRSFDLPPASRDYFDDDEDQRVHEDSINRVAEAEITAGDAHGRYNPRAVVRRGQMATFLGRALDLEPLGPKITEYLGYDNVSDDYNSGWTASVTTVNGQNYARAVVNTYRPTDSPATIDYVLSRDFERFTTTIGMEDDAEDTAETVRVRILGDGVELFASDLTYGTAVPVDLDVTDVLLLRIAVTQLAAGESSTDAPVAFAEALVVGPGPGPVVPPAPGATALGYGDHRSSDYNGGWTASTASVNGTAYQQAVVNTYRPSSTPAAIDYVLGRGYTTLGAVVGFEDNTDDSAERLQVDVFDENNRLLETLIVQYGQAVPLDVDVTGVLRVRLSVTTLDAGESSTDAELAFANLHVR